MAFETHFIPATGDDASWNAILKTALENALAQEKIVNIMRQSTGWHVVVAKAPIDFESANNPSLKDLMSGAWRPFDDKALCTSRFDQGWLLIHSNGT